MNKFVSFNRQIIPAEKSFISTVSSAALYGKGVFTSLAIYDAKPFLWAKHWRRLRENSALLGIDLNGFEEETRRALLEIITENKIRTGRARLTFFDESPGRIWNPGGESKITFLITTGDFRHTKDEFKLTVSPYRANSKSPLAGVKSCNYMENLLALEEARRRGFDECVRLNEKDEIAAAAAANIFWVKNGEIFTPALETGCLAGTTRALVTENFSVSETRSKIDALHEADEIFLTSAGIGIRPAGFEIAKTGNSPAIERLREFFDSKTTGTRR